VRAFAPIIFLFTVLFSPLWGEEVDTILAEKKETLAVLEGLLELKDRAEQGKALVENKEWAQRGSYLIFNRQWADGMIGKAIKFDSIETYGWTMEQIGEDAHVWLPLLVTDSPRPFTTGYFLVREAMDQFEKREQLSPRLKADLLRASQAAERREQIWSRDVD